VEAQRFRGARRRKAAKGEALLHNLYPKLALLLALLCRATWACHHGRVSSCVLANHVLLFCVFGSSPVPAFTLMQAVVVYAKKWCDLLFPFFPYCRLPRRALSSPPSHKQWRRKRCVCVILWFQRMVAWFVGGRLWQERVFGLVVVSFSVFHCSKWLTDWLICRHPRRLRK